MFNSSIIDILLVDDNPGDVRMARELFRDVKLSNNLNVVEDGVQALDYLHRRGEYASAKRPDLIFLEPELPRKNGYELVNEMRKSSDLQDIPVVVFAASDAEWVHIRSKNLPFQDYVTKPLNMTSLIKSIRNIGDFWLTISR